MHLGLTAMMHLERQVRIISNNPDSMNPNTEKPFTEKEKVSIKALCLELKPTRFKELFPEETKENLKKYKARYEELDKEDREYLLREYGTDEEYLNKVEVIRKELISNKHEEENTEFFEFTRMREVAKKRVHSETDAELLLKPDDYLDGPPSDSFQHYFFIKTDRGGSIFVRGIPEIGDREKLIKTSHSQNESIDILTEPVEIEIGVFHYLDDKLTYKIIFGKLIDEEIQLIKRALIKMDYKEFAEVFVRDTN